MELRESIIEEATSLFKIYGIRAVTMDSLASHLGISKRTIYEAFSDKDELVISVLKRIAEKQKQIVDKVLDNSENAVHAILMLLEANMDQFQNMSQAFQTDLRKFHYEVLMKKADKCAMPDYRNNKQIIERGIRENLFRKDINPDIVNRCLYSLGRSILDYELYPFDEFTRRDIIRNVFINYMKGISTREGIELIDKMEAKF